MSSIINATTTNGVVIQPDNSGSLVLQTNSGTTALTINTSQHTTLAGKLITASSGIQFSDSSTQTAAASPYVLKNRIINGDMRIDQRYAGAATANTINDYTVDRWAVIQSTTGKVIAQQNAAAVTPPTGFSNYLGVTSQSSYAVGSSDYYMILQRIEGFNTADLSFGTADAKTVTLSFWVRSSLTGTFGGSLRNSAGTRSYPFTYTISVANTWEQKTVTVGGDTTGTWIGSTNGIGLIVQFGLGVGSTYSGTAGAWAATNYVSATGATSVVGTNGATFYITGVQLEIGSTATPFERRLYNQELANCQRYYQCIGGAFNGSASYQYYGMGVSYNTTTVYFTVPLQVYMRTAPSFTAINTANFLLYSTGGFTPSSITADISSPNVIGIVAASSGMVAGQAFRLIQNSGNSTQIQFSAEL